MCLNSVLAIWRKLHLAVYAKCLIIMSWGIVWVKWTTIFCYCDSLKQHFLYWFWKNISDTLTFTYEIIYFSGKCTVSITTVIIYSHRNKQIYKNQGLVQLCFEISGIFTFVNFPCSGKLLGIKRESRWHCDEPFMASQINCHCHSEIHTYTIRK